MNTEGTDTVDLLIKIAIFGCFVAFAICMWFIKRDRERRKAADDQNLKPPRNS